MHTIKINPKYIFFQHWPWKIDTSIFLNYKSTILYQKISSWKNK